MEKAAHNGPNVVLSPRTYNEMISRLDRLESKVSRIQEKPQRRKVLVSNTTDENIPPFRAVAIGDPVTTPGQFSTDVGYEYQHVFNGEETNESTTKFGITQEGIPADVGGGNPGIGEIITEGITTATVDVTDTSHEYAKLSATTGVLESTSEATTICILYASDVSQHECKVLIGGFQRKSIKLENCTTGRIVYAENVDVGGGQRLLDLAGRVVGILSTLVNDGCWRVIGVDDCTPEICPVVCAVMDSCESKCLRLTQCNDSSIVKVIELPKSLVGINSPLEAGDVVLLDDNECYTVSFTECVENPDENTIVSRVENCDICGECWRLTGCWTSEVIDIFRDNHGLTVGEVVSIGGVCYTVGPSPSDCSAATHVVIDPEGRFPGCEQCGCFLLTPRVGSGLDPIVTSGSLGADSNTSGPTLRAGTIVRLDSGTCYSVSRIDSGCEASTESVTVVQEYDTDDFSRCILYELEECNGTGSIVTFSDLSAYVDPALLVGSSTDPVVIIRRAEDETCYTITGIADESEASSAVETMVEASYANCDDCLSPRYQLTPTCPSCGGGCDGAANGVNVVVDQDLSANIGKLIKYNDTCYTVSEVAFDTPTTPDITTPIVVTGPFDDCESCQRTCVWLTVRVYEDGDTIKQEQIRVIVDQVCDRRTIDVIGIEDCPTTGGP